ncbi:Imm52 family immunity protein [Mucilaginibacter rubeus]|uniref:Immunity protein 52 domain-containing protein n=1 Tax=Mucilaginibacter rubeus TaxID=2027860 RepID=A0A5C1I4E2_9SPHI|nr:Imm52 family immunity protein [Mucilaginibacter rubeus]QEM12967.1 hypothetical protein DEO27_024125 [Mucilaginibacter rubeus]
MIDSFYIGAYWETKKELLEDVIEPTLQTLEQLSELDEQFYNFYELGTSRKQAFENRIPLEFGYIKELYQKRLKKADLDQNGYSKIGYGLSLWTGQNEDESSQISFNVGSSSNKIRNRCLIKIPTEGVARERLLQLNKVKEIIKLLILKWNPDLVVLTSKELSTALDITNDLGWVTYVKAKQRKTKYKSSSRMVHESNYHGGDLFYLTTDNGLVYDYNLINEYQSLKKQIQ